MEMLSRLNGSSRPPRPRAGLPILAYAAAAPLTGEKGLLLELFSVPAILTLPGVDHALWLLYTCENSKVKDLVSLRLLGPQR